MKATQKKYIRNCTGDIQSNGDDSKSKLISRIIFYVLLLAFIGVSFFVFFFSQYLQIATINIVGAQELNASEIQQTLKASLDGKYLGIIPKNNFLFISENGVSKLLEDNFKKIRKVSLAKKFPDTLMVSIDERKALLVWCSGESCFLIDEGGVAYNVADFSTPALEQNHLLKITDLSGSNVNVGDKVLSDAYEQYILGIKDAVSVQGVDLGEEYSTPSRMAEEIDAQMQQGGQLQLSTQFSLESAMRTLGAILKKEIPKNQLANLAYIDLRSENKAFYKINGQPSTTEQLAAATSQPVTNTTEQKATESKKK